MYSLLHLLAYGIVMVTTCTCLVPGSRLLDFPNPDYKHEIYLGEKYRLYYAEVEHGLGDVPFHVRVYATAADGSNKDFVFEGTGVCQSSDARGGHYAGVLFAYNRRIIKIWVPKISKKDDSRASIIFVGDGWGGRKYSQQLTSAKITIEAWRSGPLPTFETKIPIATTKYTNKRTFKIPHSLQQLPEMISVRVSPDNERETDLHFHAGSSSQTAYDRTRYTGGVLFAYNISDIILWTPNRPKTGCIGVSKKWGNGRPYIVQNCYISIRLWINAFPPPIFQSDWTTVSTRTDPFIEIPHNVKMLPTYVRVQYRFLDTIHPLVFEGSGSIQASQKGKGRYGGVLFAYDKLKIRIWLPTSNKVDQAYIIYIGDGWGDRKQNRIYNGTAELRVQVFVDKCLHKTRVVDAQGYCRDIREIQLVQKMSKWGSCSNPCGSGKRKRTVEGCTGRSLQTIMDCNFADNMCGFQIDTYGFNWSRIDDVSTTEHTQCGKGETVADVEQLRKNRVFKKEMKLKEKHFIYSITKPCINGERIHRNYGRLMSRDLNNAKGCILTFKYAADSYYGKLWVQALPSNKTKWVEDLWKMEDGQVQHGIWHSAYIDIDHYVPGGLKKIQFFHKLPYSSQDMNPKCPERCHSVLLTNVTLRCEKVTHHVVTQPKCKEKSLPMSSCIVSAFKPARKGPAWSVRHNVLNNRNETVGSYVTANGKNGDKIATYTFDIKMSNVYHLWFDSFALSNRTNGIVFEIDGEEKKYDENLIFTAQKSIWLPIFYPLKFQAGRHTVNLYQKEKGFQYRNLMIAPRNISVYSSLGMQSHLIPNNYFQTVSGISTHLGFTRLNGKGAWMPTDNNPGKMYLEVHFPSIALVNKIATQGGRSLGNPSDIECYTRSYKLKFSKDLKSFAFYRKNIRNKEYLFPGNQDYDGIVEHTLSYTLVARAIRVYPMNYTWQACLRLEVYGFYMVKGMCPELVAKAKREKSCTGRGVCPRGNMQCVSDSITNQSQCGCNKGFHGNHCNMTGCHPNPCVEGRCVIDDTGSFTCQCAPGFYGRYCEKKCPKGRFGENCAQICKCTTTQHCNPKTGSCSCLPGYTGPKCDVTCPEGSFGQDCSENCRCREPMKCDSVSGECYCRDGYTGENCDVECSNGTYGRNCSKGCNCLNGGKCEADGKCDCPSGWMSDDCSYECPTGRYGKQCAHLCHEKLHGNSTCDRFTGILTCKKGFKGKFCHHACAEGRYGQDCMLSCECNGTNTLRCGKEDGTCVCKAGWTGQRCDEKCDGKWGFGCQHKCLCKHDGECDHITGRCTCLKGTNGTHCERKCVQGWYGFNCRNRCKCVRENMESCFIDHGGCYCKSGYKGERCEEKCDRDHFGSNCDSRCTCFNGAACDGTDGSCFCRKGWEGTSCEKKCDRGRYGKWCLKECRCQNNGLCERQDGNCTCTPGFRARYCGEICEEGKFGQGCKSTCSCEQGKTIKCDHVNGSCTCKPGFQGQHCTQDCDDGFYGNRCREPCQPCRHSYHACNKINGSCSCIDGFTGQLCMDDCAVDKYGPACSKPCNCDLETELCDNMNGLCYKRGDYTFVINLHTKRYYFIKYKNAQEKFKENLALLIWNCFKEADDTQVDPICNVQNESDYTHAHTEKGESVEESMKYLRLMNSFFVRILDLKSRYSTTNDVVTAITLTLLNDTKPVNASRVNGFLDNIPIAVLKKALNYEFYKGETFPIKRVLNPDFPRWIVIGLSGFGGLLTVFLICFICRCTKTVPYPPPFKKVRRDSKDLEMQPSMTQNSHLLAFENPYYDVIAAMGLDDDIEEDYYNPLYDNMLELQSDSETEPEDMYYAYPNTNYHRGTNHYPYDKDSGFSIT